MAEQSNENLDSEYKTLKTALNITGWNNNESFVLQEKIWTFSEGAIDEWATTLMDKSKFILPVAKGIALIQGHETVQREDVAQAYDVFQESGEGFMERAMSQNF